MGRIKRGFAMPRHVRCNHAVTQFGKMGQLRIPQVLVVTKAVQKQDHPAGAAVVIRDGFSVRNCKLSQDEFPKSQLIKIALRPEIVSAVTADVNLIMGRQKGN